MLCAMLCCETLGPGVLVDVTFARTNYKNIVVDQVHHNSNDPFYQDNALCHTAKMDQEWFEECDKEFIFWPPNSICGMY